LDKAPDAFRTISEVAEEINVPQHVLRFWESRFTQIQPLKRGGGRRYYRPDDVDLLRGVRHLLYGEGYTIRGVQRILREEGLAFVQSVWRPGAEPPPPDVEQAEVDAEDIQSEPAPRAELEPSFFARSPEAAYPASERQEPSIVPPSSRADLGAEERRKLQGVLEELIACRDLIHAALAEASGSQDQTAGLP
jgi:DNA-binding transcriptional MerR regulator